MRWPKKGAEVCPRHGGHAPQVVKAAERREREAEAQEAVKRVLDDPNAAPITNPEAELQRLAGRIRNAADVIGARVNDLTTGMRYLDERGQEQLRAEVVVWERLLGMLRHTLTDMSRLNIAARQQELDEAKLELIAAALVNAAVVAGITAGQRDALLEAMWQDLRERAVEVAG